MVKAPLSDLQIQSKPATAKAASGDDQSPDGMVGN
jgi:hypothetical protein